MRNTTKRQKSGGSTIDAVVLEEVRPQVMAQQRKQNTTTIYHLQKDECGIFMTHTDPWLTASPDEAVHDPSDAEHTLSLVEIKNVFSAQEETLGEKR